MRQLAILALVTGFLAACSEPTPAFRNVDPTQAEAARRAAVEFECARYPERCDPSNYNPDQYDDSNLPPDPCRDYGDCDSDGILEVPGGSSSNSADDGCPNGCTDHPPGCDIKGNIAFETNEKIYHVPGQQYYNETKISPEYGERWFCTEDEATANGWRKAKV